MSEEKVAGPIREDRVNLPSIHDLYRLATEVRARPPIQLTEDELKSTTGRKKQHCIFANEDMMKKYEALPDDVKRRFKDYGDDYYSRVIDSISGSIEKAAEETLRSVRAGISPRELTPDELTGVRTVYGNEWFKLAGLESEQDD
jgi:hypothetical protein